MSDSFRDSLKRVGWTFAQAFIATALTLAPGVLEAPDLRTARALASAAIVAAIAAGISALKNAIAAPGSALR